MYHPKNTGSSMGTILFLALACLPGSIQQGLGQAVLPLKPNQLVITCFSGTSNNAVIPDPDNYVIGFMDTRDPLGDGATLGSNWTLPPGWAFHNETSTDEWTAANLGEVFGVTLDDAPAPNIYTSASTVYGDFPPGPGGHGAVYRLDGNTGSISYLTIPGIGKASLGNLCHWESGNGTSWLYVTSFEDGLVYRINVDSWP